MNKQVVTKTEQEELNQSNKLDLEGVLFYILIISVVAILPLSSAIWLLSVA